ncbi:acyl-CoA/acyl-ACP dehydrogenase [Paraconexibacter antarcticus]|uniref:Acyl-CoA/acyl-ACP dehydrogenase n=1 Tax=Paraconexibacter antarcticus TaxID=2949664 RepID=A0ABY5DPF2_9ACTN|nr:acyl-CoA dehydrogenase family protein [Paraconexibacter antarcticus]UTI62657.1 acyl-CoA/acyl-ACP dehydrogenase [Paraconexibacter antarcticus]
MRFDLDDDERALREAAADALSRTPTVALARDALEDPAARPDLWPTAVQAGWPGLLVGEDAGGAGLGVRASALVLREAGARLAGTGLLGHLPSSALLAAAGHALTAPVATGTVRAALAGALPPGDLEPRWTVDRPAGSARAAVPSLAADGTLSGLVAWVPDAPGADVLLVTATDPDGAPCAALVHAGAPGVTVEPVAAYDASASLAHVHLDGAEAERLDALGARELARAWQTAQVLLAAEAVGAVGSALDASVAYAQERWTFGRPIGSYQAVKHGLVEVLRLRENADGLLTYGAWALDEDSPEAPLAAAAARAAAGHALDVAARTMIAVHGGIGATWEHDAPLFFRRAQTHRRLLGGEAAAVDRVAGELLAGATV